MNISVKTLASACLCALVLSGCASQQRIYEVQRLANPSSVVAAEIAFARMAQEDGQWTAFRKYATGDADMFVPQRVNARQWLGDQQDPPRSVAWQPHRVYISCDGLAAVSTGAWQRPNGTEGYFTTVWLRQPNGSWKWILDHGDQLGTPRVAPDSIGTRTAVCEGSPPASLTAPAVGVDLKVGYSADQTLSWSSAVSPDGSRKVTAKIWTGSSFETVLEDNVGPE